MSDPVSVVRSLLLGIALLALAGPVLSQAPELPEFEIEDQFGTVHTHEQIAGAGVLVVASGRGGRETNTEWGRALRQALTPEIDAGRIVILPVADVRGVPFFLKGSIRGRFSEDPERWVLLDWDGVFAGTFGLEPDHSTVLLFAPDGRLVSRTAAGKPDEVRVRMIAELAREALATS